MRLVKTKNCFGNNCVPGDIDGKFEGGKERKGKVKESSPETLSDRGEELKDK